MPPAIAAAVIAAGATTTGAVISAKSGTKSRQLQARTDDAALAEQQTRDAEAKRQFDASQAFEVQKFAASEEQRLHDRSLADAQEARRAPYRAASQAALARLGDMLGLHFDTSMPAGGNAPAGAPLSTAPRNGLLSSPMLMGTPPPSPATPYDARRPSYAEINPAMAGQLLNLRPRDPRVY